ncbi:MAG: response regulator transcription factor [Spirochaetota bacterium]
MQESRYRKVLELLAEAGSLDSFDACADYLVAHLGDLVGIDVYCLLFSISDGPRFRLRTSAGSPVDPDVLRMFNARFSDRLPPALDMTRAVTTVDWSDYPQSEYYNELIRPQRIGHSASLLIDTSWSRSSHLIALHRTPGSHSFTHEDGEMLSLLRPHVRNLFDLYAKIDDSARGRLLPPELADGCRVLSRRQREVADLLCRRLTVPEIAARLRVGVRTVETHVEHVYGKLGVTNRKDLLRLLLGRDGGAGTDVCTDVDP